MKNTLNCGDEDFAIACLREEIRMALSDAISYEDFAEKFLRRGITVKESRGRLSYLTPRQFIL